MKKLIVRDKFTDQLSVSEDLIEIEVVSSSMDRSLSDQQPRKENKCTKFIKAASIGQYRTPLYYQKEEYYSSKTGGIITLILASVFLAYSAWQITSVFRNSDWNIDEKSENLSRVERDESGKIIKQDHCDDEKCGRLNLDQFVNAYFDHKPVYCIAYPEENWPIQKEEQCENLQVRFYYVGDNYQLKMIYSEKFSEWIKIDSLLRCCIQFNATDVLLNMKKLGIDLEENSLEKGFNDKEYTARIFIQFYNLRKGNYILVSVQNNLRVTIGGKSIIEQYAPPIPFSGQGLQKLQFVEFKQYSSQTDLFFEKPESVLKTLQFISQNSDPLSQQDTGNSSVLGLYIQQDKTIYHYYPFGIVQALSKLGGLLAILQVSIIIECIHKRWFDKEVTKIIAKSKITADGEEEQSDKRMQIQSIYSIEQFNDFMRRLKQLEEKTEHFGKIN